MLNERRSGKGKTEVKAFREALLLGLLALIPALVAGGFHPRAPAWNLESLREDEVSLATALAWGKETLWVDARSSHDYEKDHVPGALLLNEDHWSELFPQVLQTWDSHRKIVVYCDHHQCQSSRDVARRLHETGLQPAYVLKGGWEAWRKEKP